MSNFCLEGVNLVEVNAFGAKLTFDRLPTIEVLLMLSGLESVISTFLNFTIDFIFSLFAIKFMMPFYFLCLSFKLFGSARLFVEDIF